MILTLLTTFILLAVGAAEEVCYDEIGCFSNDAPFYDPPLRPVSWLPQSRLEVGTIFLLNTRQNPAVADVLTTADDLSIVNSHFNPAKETKLICHGYTEDGDVEWMVSMMEALLTNSDHNVIRVSWEQGATATYGRATANTRIVGAEAALLINRLMALYGISGQSFHFIGHSLGAHVAGYTGERVTGLGRITGLDAAGPYFEGTEPIVRLDPSDASFVDVIHTDTDVILTLGMGIHMPSGHVDIYVNGGSDQPGCWDAGLVDHIIDNGDGAIVGTVTFVICNHLIAYNYFIESCNDGKPWMAYECDGTWDDFKNGQCFDTGKMIRTQYYGDTSTPEPGVENVIYYMKTNIDEPYGGYQFKVKVYFDDSRRMGDEKGQLYLTLIGEETITNSIQLSESTEKYERGKNYKYVLFSSDNPGSLLGVQLRWYYDPDWYKPWDWDVFVNPDIFVNKIELVDGQDGARYAFCWDGGAIKAEDDIATFLPGTSCV